MKKNELKVIAESLIDTFKVAGKESIDLYDKGLKIEIKEDKSPVSNGDLRVNEMITKNLETMCFCESLEIQAPKNKLIAKR